MSSIGSSYGLINHMAAVNVLRSSVHKKKVFEMLLTGETITAREALEYGLLNTVRAYYLSWNVD